MVRIKENEGGFEVIAPGYRQTFQSKLDAVMAALRMAAKMALERGFETIVDVPDCMGRLICITISDAMRILDVRRSDDV